MQDISTQSRIPLALISVDAAQCYDRVNHVMLALLWTALLKNLIVVKVILECLQNIKFYQRSGYGDSADCYGGPEQPVKWMGLGQGSRGASQGWVQNSSTKINVLKKCGYGAELAHPITKKNLVIHLRRVPFRPKAAHNDRFGGVDSDSSDGECELDDDEVSYCLGFSGGTAVGQLGADGCEQPVVSSRVC